MLYVLADVYQSWNIIIEGTEMIYEKILIVGATGFIGRNLYDFLKIKENMKQLR